MLTQGKSMHPAYHNMQIVVLDKRNATYQIGDVIGNNLNKSKDSRDIRVGIVHADDIIGRVFHPKVMVFGSQ